MGLNFNLLENPAVVLVLTQMIVNLIKMRRPQIEGNITLAISLAISILLSFLTFTATNDPFTRQNVALTFISALIAWAGAAVNQTLQKQTLVKRADKVAESFHSDHDYISNLEDEDDRRYSNIYNTYYNKEGDNNDLQRFNAFNSRYETNRVAKVYDVNDREG